MMNCHEVQNVLFENMDGLLSSRAQAAPSSGIWSSGEACRNTAQELQRSSAASRRPLSH